MPAKSGRRSLPRSGEARQPKSPRKAMPAALTTPASSSLASTGACARRPATRDRATASRSGRPRFCRTASPAVTRWNQTCTRSARVTHPAVQMPDSRSSRRCARRGALAARPSGAGTATAARPGRRSASARPKKPRPNSRDRPPRPRRPRRVPVDARGSSAGAPAAAARLGIAARAMAASIGPHWDDGRSPAPPTGAARRPSAADARHEQARRGRGAGRSRRGRPPAAPR